MLDPRLTNQPGSVCARLVLSCEDTAAPNQRTPGPGWCPPGGCSVTPPDEAPRRTRPASRLPPTRRGPLNRNWRRRLGVNRGLHRPTVPVPHLGKGLVAVVDVRVVAVAHRLAAGTEDTRHVLEDVAGVGCRRPGGMLGPPLRAVPGLHQGLSETRSRGESVTGGKAAVPCRARGTKEDRWRPAQR